jgi:fatty acid amide hydrolase
VESAVRIAEAVTSGATRAADVLLEHVARHRERHRSINALVQPRHEAATAEAAQIDEQPPGLLAGVPVSVKECFPVRGLVTSLGIEARRSARDEHDAEIVGRLRSAGAVIVGKANVPQAMYLHETDNPVWGRTNNPHAADRGPGGSSGGDAALVAAGVVPLAVGNDLAGSVRQPAHACGLAAILPRSTVLGASGAFDTMPLLTAVRPRAGLLARTVSDLERALDALGVATGPAPGQRPLRVCWWIETGPLEPSPAVVRGVITAVERLERAGVEAVRVDGGMAVEAMWLMLAILSADGGRQVRSLFAGGRPIRPVARLLRLAAVPGRLRRWMSMLARFSGRRLEAEAVLRTGPRSAADLAGIVVARDDFRVRLAEAWSGYDACVCPVSALPALRHGTAAKLLLAAAPCLLANLVDLPAGTVPVTRVRPEEERGRGWSLDPVRRASAWTDEGSRGLPIGVQVIGGPGRSEATVLEILARIEAGGESVAAPGAGNMP